MDAQQEDEHGNQECRQAEAALDEKPGEIGTKAATGVRELLMLVQQFTVARVFYHALVGSSRREEREERQYQVDGYDDDEQAEEEVQPLVVEDILEANSLGERGRLALCFLFFLCHISACLSVFQCKSSRKSSESIINTDFFCNFALRKRFER